MKQTQPPLEIGMLLYPGLTLLDLFGPQTVFSWFANTHLVWKTKDLILSDTGIGVQPTCHIRNVPAGTRYPVRTRRIRSAEDYGR